MIDYIDLPQDHPPGMSEFYPLLGRFIVAWSHIERSIDMANLLAREYDDRFKGTYIPWSAKLDAFKRICNRHPRIVENSGWLSPQFGELETAAGIRNLIYHGNCKGVVSKEPTTVRFENLIYRKGQQEMREIDITIESLAGILHDLRSLSQQLLFVTLALTPAINLETASSEK